MRIAVFGAGAVGGYFGGRLAQAGEEVAFLARGAHLSALQRSGLRVDSIGGDLHLHPVEATDDPARVGPVDVVILGVKAWQVPEAAQAMGPLLGPRTFVLPLQNGVEAPDQLARVLGSQRVLGGLCRLFSQVVEPGRIRHSAHQPYVALGELDGGRSQRVEALRRAFERAGVQVEVPEDIRAALWEKLLLIGPFGGLGAATRAPAGVLRELPETRGRWQALMEEVAGVAARRGVRLSAGVIPAAWEILQGFPPEATSSLQRDILAGRPSELDAQVGAADRLAREAGGEAPLHALLYHVLLPQERRARGQLDF